MFPKINLCWNIRCIASPRRKSVFTEASLICFDYNCLKEEKEQPGVYSNTRNNAASLIVLYWRIRSWELDKFFLIDRHHGLIMVSSETYFSLCSQWDVSYTSRIILISVGCWYQLKQSKCYLSKLLFMCLRHLCMSMVECQNVVAPSKNTPIAATVWVEVS